MTHATDVYDVIVVGAGVVGLSAACQAARRGKKTLLLDQVRNRACERSDNRIASPENIRM